MPPTKQTRRGCRTNGSLEANGNPVGTLFQDSLPCQAGSDWTGRLPRRYADRLAVQVAAAREERSFPRRARACIAVRFIGQELNRGRFPLATWLRFSSPRPRKRIRLSSNPTECWPRRKASDCRSSTVTKRRRSAEKNC